MLAGVVAVLGALFVVGFFTNGGPRAVGEQSGEPVSLPVAVENSCVGFLIGAPNEAENIGLAGGGWARPHPGPFSWGFIEPEPGTYDFSQTDAFVMAAQEQDVAILATVWPYAEWDQAGKPECAVGREDQFYPRSFGPFGGQVGVPPVRCAPQDTVAYQAFVAALVERYDGDGQADMAGLELPIRYWEIGNEPDLQDAPDLTFFTGTTGEYVELLRLSYAAVKDACADCQVVQGGAAGTDPSFLQFWQEVIDLGGARYFDIANVHYISFGDAATLNAGPFRALLTRNNISKPLWVTEVEFGEAGGGCAGGDERSAGGGGGEGVLCEFWSRRARAADDWGGGSDLS